MRKSIVALAAALALAATGTAAAALSPSVFDPGHTGCVRATYNNGVLHLEKNCSTSTNASAGADITGFAGQTFSSASFTLANASQCQGGSPRFNVQDVNNKVFFLGCNNVTPTINPNGTATYTFTLADLLRINPTLGTPGAIKTVQLLIDVQGSADASNIFFNGVGQVVSRGDDNHNGPGGKGHDGNKGRCKNGGWKSMTNPTFKNQGQCVSYFNHLGKHSKHDKHKGHHS